MTTVKYKGKELDVHVPEKAAPDEKSFWEKIKKAFKKMGGELVILAIELWLVMKSPATPIAIKTAIGSALAYLVLPVDLIPDFIPVVGYSDDLVALMAVAKMASMYITDAIKAQAKRIFDDL